MPKLTEEVIRNILENFVQEYKTQVETKYIKDKNRLLLYNYLPPFIDVLATKDGDYFSKS